MKHLKKTTLFSLVAVSFILRTTVVHAIPIPSLAPAELASQIDQLGKHIQELNNIKNQITNGIDQAKAMGDKLSMDALKQFASGKLNSALSGGLGALSIPKEMEKAGFTEDVSKDPEKIKGWLDGMKGKDGTAMTEEQYGSCAAARASMSEELALSGLANSLSLQQNLASGEDMKSAQEASGASDDQMQLIGANSATLKVMYQQAAASTVIEANRLAASAISEMCQ